ncbi:MAG TPA: hypothetical protein VEC57_00960 [Candidatus Limnocylindrales bacterium]|nr:hypothetical protein [Candidatus Limnocylindrales bacterium]
MDLVVTSMSLQVELGCRRTSVAPLPRGLSPGIQPHGRAGIREPGTGSRSTLHASDRSVRSTPNSIAKICRKITPSRQESGASFGVSMLFWRFFDARSFGELRDRRFGAF